MVTAGQHPQPSLVNTFQVQYYNYSKLRWERIGRRNSEEEAEKAVAELKQQGFKARWIVRNFHAV